MDWEAVGLLFVFYLFSFQRRCMYDVWPMPTPTSVATIGVKETNPYSHVIWQHVGSVYYPEHTD